MSTFKLYNEKTAQTPAHVLFNQKKENAPAVALYFNGRRGLIYFLESYTNTGMYVHLH